MNYKMTLSGRYIVTGADVKMLWSLVLANGLCNGNVWADFSDAKDSGSVKINLRAISALFEFGDLSRSEFVNLITAVIEEKTTISGASNEVYLKMLETAKHSLMEV
jgi:hypothetical protein